MIKVFLICIGIPCLSFAQNDFETRYFTINATSLPDMSGIPSILDILPKTTKGSFTLGEAPTYQNALNTNTINTHNYWQPVDIGLAMNSNTITYSNTQFNASKLQEKQFGFSISGNGGVTSFEFSDGETKVRNDVYKEQGAPFLINSYQQRPYYRRNPFRVNRSMINFDN
jgi:hypothetical protein